MKKLLLAGLTAISALSLAACGDDKNEVVKIGINAADGPQWPILEEKLEKEGIDIELVEFSDYTLPNNALAQGDIDLNAFQHISFLASYVNESGNELIPLGSTVFVPLNIIRRQKP